MKKDIKEKILVVTSTFPKSQDDIVSARFVLDLSKALKEYYEVHVLTPHSPDSLRDEVVEGVQVHRFRYFFPKSLQRLTRGAGIMANIKESKLLFLQLPFLFISEIFNIIRIVRKEKIDVINSHWIVPQGLAVAFVKNFLKTKHVMTIHAAGIFTLKRWGNFGNNLAKYITNRTDIVFPVSSYIKDTLDSLVKKEYYYKILPMGVTSDRFNGLKKGMCVVKEGGEKVLKLLFVGKLVEKKGLKHLLEALGILKGRGVRVCLTVAGSGPLEKELKDYVSRERLDSSVSFCGWTPNNKLPEFYSASDITVVPSIYDKKGETEGMPVVVLESLAMGTPVLGSKISGIPDIIEDRENGWLVDPASSESIAEKIEELTNLDLSSFSKSAVKTAEKYTFRNIALEYKKSIDKIK